MQCIAYTLGGASYQRIGIGENWLCNIVKRQQLDNYLATFRGTLEKKILERIVAGKEAEVRMKNNITYVFGDSSW